MTTHKDRTLIETHDSFFFKQLLVLMLRERIASLEYDYALTGSALSQQNAALEKQRTDIRTLLRRFCPADNFLVTQFSGDLSKPAAAIHFSAQPRHDPVPVHFRVELPFELWSTQGLADLVRDALGTDTTLPFPSTP